MYARADDEPCHQSIDGTFLVCVMNKVQCTPHLAPYVYHRNFLLHITLGQQIPAHTNNLFLENCVISSLLPTEMK